MMQSQPPQTPLKECWINVYQDIPPFQCVKHRSLGEALISMKLTRFDYPVYRIHVKIDGGYNKRQMAHLKPFYKNIINKDAMDKKFNWMG